MDNRTRGRKLHQCSVAPAHRTARTRGIRRHLGKLHLPTRQGRGRGSGVLRLDTFNDILVARFCFCLDGRGLVCWRYGLDLAAGVEAGRHQRFSDARIDGITATFTQGGATIYDTDSLDDLKQYLVVTANYSDSSEAVVSSSDYVLSGSLVAPSSTITVTYNGFTDTFTVQVTQSIPIIQVVVNGNFADGGKTPLDGQKDMLVLSTIATLIISLLAVEISVTKCRRTLSPLATSIISRRGHDTLIRLHLDICILLGNPTFLIV